VVEHHAHLGIDSKEAQPPKYTGIFSAYTELFDITSECFSNYKCSSETIFESILGSQFANASNGHNFQPKISHIKHNFTQNGNLTLS